MLNPSPPPDCPLCPRLHAFRHENRRKYPDFFNDPVPCFGPLDAQLAVIGLAPGLKGANRTGRPFTGDYAGLVLYPALKRHGFARGEFKAEADDGFTLVNARIINAVRCVPPQNKPEPSEIATCNPFLQADLQRMEQVKVVLTLGAIAHKAVLKAFSLKQAPYKFAHAAEHALPNGCILLNSYHTSRYNINTGVLTEAMFDAVVGRAHVILRGA